ncbi:MAG: hypothetical protein GQ527_08675, partial [Bacteroidales bacterium]|nr:hypothetical protein [Bacteroidales bacterium]
IKRIKYGALIHALILIFIIWAYALITGLSPSVSRAATMFTFISIGGIMNRKTSTYNSLAASAFVLLITNPFLLFHIGFQLSYLAVLSILFLQPHLSSIVDSRIWIFKKSRDLVAVSIAAQLGTFPLAIYYFHQFPNYFIITNLIVIPLSFTILIAGFASIFVFIIGLGKTIVGWAITQVLYYLLWILNTSMDWINKFPLAVSRNLYFSEIDTVLVYLIIIFFSLSLIYKKYKYIIVVFVSFIILFGSNTWLRYQAASSSSLTVYHIPKSTVIELSYKEESTLFIDSLLMLDTEGLDRYIIEYHLHKRIKKKKYFNIDRIQESQATNYSFANNVLLFNNQSFLIVDGFNLLPNDTVATKFDYVLFRNNPNLSMQTLTSKVDFEMILFDGSNSYWKISKWQQQCADLGLASWNLKEKGAFVINAPLLPK